MSISSPSSASSRWSPSSAPRLWVVCVCFFISGIAGLIYEVVWSRYLALFLGSTGQAHVIVLATYMSGLALGAALLGRAADRSPNPLRLYVLLELGIGMFGLIYPRLFEPLRGLFLALVRAAGLHPLGTAGAGILTCALSILIPTTLMGGTLPVLSRLLITRRGEIGRHIARLYYLNSLGAVFGALLAGFYLLRAFGLEMSLIAAAILNFAAAGLAWVLVLRSQSDNQFQSAICNPQSESDGGADEAVRGPRLAGGDARATTALIVIALSGFTSMVYEVAWIRLLALTLGSASTSFSLMLAAFISGITLGSFLLARKRTDEGYFPLLGACELAIGLTVLLSMLTYQRLPGEFFRFRTCLVPADYTYPVYQCGVLLLCFLVMLAPTIFMGAALPAASRVVADDPRAIGRKVGGVYAVNTVGTLLGAALTGFWLLPALGIRHAIELAAGLNVALGLWVLASAREKGPKGRKGRKGLFTGWKFAATSALFIAGFYAWAMPHWDERLLSAGLFRMRTRSIDPAAVGRLVENRKMLYAKDGTDATVVVYSEPGEGGGPDERFLVINGKADASDRADMNTQLMLGHLPMLLHPAAREVLVVGLGSGVTAGAVALHEPEHVDCVELLPEVAEAAPLFGHVNHDVLHNPKFTLHIQDAKTFLQVTPRRYDAIVSEPTNPWIAGVAGLFSREYYAMARQRLAPGGLFVQWIQCYELQDLTLFSMLATFNEAFPYSTMFNFWTGDIALAGAAEPFEPDFGRMEAALRRPAVAADLAAYGIHGLLPVLSMQMAAKTRTRAPYVTLGGVNSDFFPWLEYEAFKGVYVGANAGGIQMLDRRGWAPGRSGLWIERYEPSRKPEEKVFVDFNERLARSGGLFGRIRANWCSLWRRYYPESAALRLAEVELNAGAGVARAAALEDWVTSGSNAALKFKLELLRSDYEARRSVACLPDGAALRQVLAAALARLPETEKPALLRDMGDLELDRQHPEEAFKQYCAALEALEGGAGQEAGGRTDLRPARLELLLRMADALIDMGRADEARRALGEARRIPGTPALRSLLDIVDCRIAQIAEK